MKIYRIGHAGLIVDAADTLCIMDPVLFEPFECGVNCFEPSFTIDPRGVHELQGLLILSHEHMDHFCVASLDQIHRGCAVVYPAGCALIERVVRVMGFRELWPVVPGQTVRYRSLELTFTPSKVAFPELGVLFSHGGQCFWNCVDTELAEPAFALVSQRVERLDLMFASYQVLIEEELGCDALGASFPFERYAERLRAVLEAKPRCVVPASCGYRYARADWQNHRGFPVTEAGFLADVQTLVPEIVGRTLTPGAMIDTEDFTVRADALPFITSVGSTDPGVLAWRPDRGVPALEDEDPQGHGTTALRREATTLLGGEFLAELAGPRLGRWRERLAAGGVVWQLDIVHPDGSIDSRWLDFASSPPRWLAEAPREPKLVTSICASTVVGLAVGEVTPYRALFTRRVVQRLYTPTRWGLQRIGTLADEPIARVLFPRAELRYVDAQLRRLGYHPEGTGSTAGVRQGPRATRGVATLPGRR